MTIKEIETMLNIPRATVRFYEKENLVHPIREKNGYRNYSEEDVAVLMKVVTLRKLGIKVEDIKDILDGARTMEEVVKNNIFDLQEQIEELNGALKLSQIICERKESIETFDENYYWNIVLEEERKGNKFVSLARDVLKYEKHMILSEFSLEDSEGNLSTTPAKAILISAASCVCCGIVWMLLDGKLSIVSFREGLLFPLEMIIVGSCIGLPVFLIGRKKPKVAEVLKKIGWVLASLITIVLLVLILMDWVRG